MKTICFFRFAFTCSMGIILFLQTANGQNTFPSTGSAGIGTTTPDASSLLEIKSTAKGILIPRMSQHQRDNISLPAQGLIIYQTNNSPGFYYYDGSQWNPVSGKNADQSLSNLTQPTAVNVDLLPDSNNTRSLGNGRQAWENIYVDSIHFDDGTTSSGSFWKKKGSAVFYTNGNVGIGTNNPLARLQVSGGDAIINSLTVGNGAGSVSSNTVVGNSAFVSNTTGTNNTATGAYSLSANTSGVFNTGSGSFTLNANTTGIENTATGWGALFNNISGSYNTAAGVSSLLANHTGSDNAGIGFASLYSDISGNDNTAAGGYSLYLNTAGYSNVAIGVAALRGNTVGHNLVAVGDSALYNQGIAMLNSYTNTAIGSKTLYSNTSGIRNTATGFNAVYSNITGTDNTAAGNQALSLNTAGNSNSAFGSFALWNNTGDNNTATGYQSLISNATGHDNTASGYGSLIFNTNGYGNTADGFNALPQNTSGFYNTAVGEFCLYSSFGNGNTALGYSADVSSAAISNSTAIGLDAIVNAGNTVLVGSSSITSVGGYVNWSNFSDGRYKQNIKQNVPGLQFINRLHPITYTLNINAIESKLHSTQKTLKDADGNPLPRPEDDPVIKQNIDEKSKIVYTGFIAQDVEKAAGSIDYNFSGVDKPKDDQQSFYGLRYGDFVVPLVKAVQELSSQNDSLKNENALLRKDFNDLKNLVLSIEQKQEQCSPCAVGTSPQLQINNAVITNGAALEQNVPNPFTNGTSIGYVLPQKYTRAQIVITDKNGKTLLVKDVSGVGKGKLNLDASVLASEAYNYSLLIDGKLIATKQMVVAR